MNDKTITRFPGSHKQENTPISKITPREVLLMALNAVEDFDCVVVISGKINNDGTVTTRVNSSAANVYVETGLIATALQIRAE